MESAQQMARLLQMILDVMTLHMQTVDDIRGDLVQSLVHVNQASCQLQASNSIKDFVFFWVKDDSDAPPNKPL